MRILINAVSARDGGGVSYLLNLLEYLPRNCPDIEFLAAIPDISLPGNFSPPTNLEIRIIASASGNALKRYLWENTGLIKLCKNWRADVLFCVANVIPIISPRIPTIVMIQNVAPLTERVFKYLGQYESKKKYIQMLLLRYLTFWAIFRSKISISLSEATAELIKSIFPKVTSPVIYHGITNIFNPDASKPVKLPSKPYLLSVSSIYVYKGIEYLIEAMASDSEIPDLYIAGKTFDYGYRAMLNDLIAKYSLSNRIIFLDGIDYNELPGWYANACAMVYTSWCENCPNILLEAMACGCPIVAMDIGPMPEICQEAGIYSIPFNSASLAEKIREVLEQPREILKNKALNRAKSFNWNDSMKLHSKIIREAQSQAKDLPDLSTQ